MTNAPVPNIEARFRAYAEKLSTALGHVFLTVMAKVTA